MVLKGFWWARWGLRKFYPLGLLTCWLSHRFLPPEWSKISKGWSFLKWTWNLHPRKLTWPDGEKNNHLKKYLLLQKRKIVQIIIIFYCHVSFRVWCLPLFFLHLPFHPFSSGKFGPQLPVVECSSFPDWTAGTEGICQGEDDSDIVFFSKLNRFFFKAPEVVEKNLPKSACKRWLVFYLFLMFLNRYSWWFTILPILFRLLLGDLHRFATNFCHYLYIYIWYDISFVPLLARDRF